VFNEAVLLTSLVAEHSVYCLTRKPSSKYHYLGINERFVSWSCECTTLSPLEDSPSIVTARRCWVITLPNRSRYMFQK